MIKSIKKGLFALGLAGLLALMPGKAKAEDLGKKFSVGVLYEVGQPSYTSLKADHEEYNKTKRGIISNYKDLTNPGLLNMLGAEASFALTKNLNLTGSFSTSVGNQWNYNEDYTDPTYKNLQRNEKADILEGKLGLEGNIEAGNWSFSAGGGAVWNDVNFQSNHTTTFNDGNWVKIDTNTSGNGWGWFGKAKVNYKFNENISADIGVSYENNPTNTTGRKIISNSQGGYSNDTKNLPFELERTNLEGNFIFAF